MSTCRIHRFAIVLMRTILKFTRRYLRSNLDKNFMPKIKTKKSVTKKVRITKRRKVLRLYTKQNHFNSRETGKFKRLKRKSRRLMKANEHNVLKALPYAN